jgi:hypothetical protein
MCLPHAQVLDLEAIDPELRGFSGGFFHRGRAYFVPFRTGSGQGTRLVSVDAATMAAASVQVIGVVVCDPACPNTD